MHIYSDYRQSYTGVLYRQKSVFQKKYCQHYTIHLLIILGVKSNRIEVSQKKVIRLVTNGTYFAHTTPLFKAERLLKVLEKCTKNLIGHSRLAFNNHESNIDC